MHSSTEVFYHVNVDNVPVYKVPVIFASPTTFNLCEGVVVPIPTSKDPPSKVIIVFGVYEAE